MVDWSSLDRGALTLADGVAVNLERMIRDGTLKVGDRIPAERDLAELAGVSRASVREALHDLEVRGLVDRKPGRGTIVTSDDREALARLALRDLSEEGADVLDVMELRALIEPPIAARAAEQATRRDAAQLEELVDEMSPELSAERFTQLDRSFHDGIARCTHNPLLVSLTERIASLIEPSRNVAVQSRPRRVSSIQGHRMIVAAIRRGDAQGAFDAAAAHVGSVREHIIESSIKRSSRSKRPGRSA